MKTGIGVTYLLVRAPNDLVALHRDPEWVGVEGEPKLSSRSDAMLSTLRGEVLAE